MGSGTNMVIFHAAFAVNILGWVLSIECGQEGELRPVDDDGTETVQVASGEKSSFGFSHQGSDV